MKLVVLTNILTPYRIPLFTALQRRVERLVVLLMAKEEENRQWKLGTTPFEVDILPGVHVKPKGADVSLHFNRGVIRTLRRLNPDVVLSGGFSTTNLCAQVYCKLHHKKYICWAHLTLQDGAHASLMKRMLRQWMIRQADGAIGESSDAREAFIHYGARPDEVKTVVMPLDVTHLHEQTVQFKTSDKYKVFQQDYSTPVLLSIGQLIKRKGYQEFFAICAELLKSWPSLSVIIVGDGSERQAYETYVKNLGWKHIHFVGYVQAVNLHKYLAIADVFVFHTLYDPFGLVLSEAMAAELPVVSSIYASSTNDLVEEGVTGFRIDPMNAQESAAKIDRLLRMPQQERESMGRAGYRCVKQYDADSAAEAIVQFLKSRCLAADCHSTYSMT